MKRTYVVGQLMKDFITSKEAPVNVHTMQSKIQTVLAA